MNRVIFYFDGFNFYNGLKEKSDHDSDWKKYYWLDFFKFCSSFIKDGKLEKIKYFTAPPSDDGQRSRQAALFGANRLLYPDVFESIYGNYQTKKIKCKKCQKYFEHPEEKRTDVNIALAMILDCALDKADTLVLISADSDQCPTAQKIKQLYPNKKLKIYFPPKRNSSELLAIAKPVVFLEDNQDKFEKAILPNVVEKEGKKYTKPLKWQ